MKQSIVKRATHLPDKTWSNEYGTFYVHGIVMENGDFGEYSSKSEVQEYFIAGQQATYELSGVPGRQKIKPVAPDHKSFVSGGPSIPKDPPKQKQDDRNKSFALAYAKDIACANLPNWQLDEMELLQLAETFNAWLNGEKKEEPIAKDPSDDLPF